MIAEETLYGIHGDGPGYGEDNREGVGPWGGLSCSEEASLRG